MKNILLPTDLSELSGFAFDLAQKIAKATDADIHALTIIPTPPRAVFDQDGNLKEGEGEDYSAWYQQEAERQKNLKEWVKDKPEVIRTEVKIGRVKEDILSYIDDHKIDLVVMGTHGAAGMDEMLRGSNTEYIVSHANVPTMCLKCARPNMSFEDILIVGDFKEKEAEDLTVLKTLQNAFASTLHLLRINTREDFETNAETEDRMDVFAMLNELRNVKFHVYNDKSVEAGIANFCQKSGIDFVAIGTHQRSTLSRLFNHSISEEVVNHIYQPILCFPI